YLLALALFVAGISALLASSLLQGFAGVPVGQVLRAVPGLLGPWLSFALSDFSDALSELKRIMRHCREN
ncbi:hypothetical protein QO207_08850, partial [Pseudomonas sp. CAN2814]|uniref:hypothetical protein n=1 Tax=Pseudomonas sp. CAN1 TaxID=3046726 RepID=UPI0026484F22